MMGRNCYTLFDVERNWVRVALPFNMRVYTRIHDAFCVCEYLHVYVFPRARKRPPAPRAEPEKGSEIFVGPGPEA